MDPLFFVMERSVFTWGRDWSFMYRVHEAFVLEVWAILELYGYVDRVSDKFN